MAEVGCHENAHALPEQPQQHRKLKTGMHGFSTAGMWVQM